MFWELAAIGEQKQHAPPVLIGWQEQKRYGREIFGSEKELEKELKKVSRMWSEEKNMEDQKMRKGGEN